MLKSIVQHPGLSEQFTDEKWIELQGKYLLKGDQLRLQQIISNLVKHALARTKNDHIRIFFCFDQQKRSFVAQVKFSGSGMSIQEQIKLESLLKN